MIMTDGQSSRVLPLDHADPALAPNPVAALAGVPSPDPSLDPDPARGGVARVGGDSAWFGAAAAA
jgi:hypothetical protein